MTAIRVCALWATITYMLAAVAVAAPLRVAVISDMNGSYGSADYGPAVSKAIERIVALAPDIVISTGDMVAGQRRPHLSETEIRDMWTGFHRVVTDPLTKAGIPLAVTPGNHDASAYSGFEQERRIYAKEWLQRKPALNFLAEDNYPFSYAFDLGPVRFISLDVTTVGTLDDRQMTWLQEISGKSASTIVFSHLPIWPFAQGREAEIIGDPALEALLIEKGIALHLSGHHHAFYPGVVNGLAVVSQACLGSGPRRLLGDEKKSALGITVVEISEAGEIMVSALVGPGFDTAFDVQTLPPAVPTPLRLIERLDLSPTQTVKWDGGTARGTD